MKWYAKYGIYNVVWILPAYAVNLAAVWVMYSYFHFEGYWILSAVTIGDVIAYIINLQMSIWLQVHLKWLHKLQDESKEFLKRK
jgi:peptidoglycan biosynthesis protein MviN/MurJ (putative lipid II flippase)